MAEDYTEEELAELEELKQLTPYALPDNPSAEGWSASQVKAKFYEGFVYIYNLFRSHRSDISSELADIEAEMEEIGAYYQALTDGTTAVPKAVADEDGNRIKETYAKVGSSNTFNGTTTHNAQVILNGSSYIRRYSGYTLAKVGPHETVMKTYDLPYDYFNHGSSAETFILATTSHVDALKEMVQAGSVYAGKAKCDLSGNTITATYATKTELNAAKADILALQSGTQVAEKAYKDQYGNLIDTTYLEKAKVATSTDDADNTKVPNLTVVKALLSQLVNGAPEAFDTLKEISDFLANPSNEYFNNLMTQLGLKLSIAAAAETYLSKTDAASIYATIANLSALSSQVTAQNTSLQQYADNAIAAAAEVGSFTKFTSLGNGRYSYTSTYMITCISDGRYVFDF